MKKTYLLISVALLLFGVTSSAGVFDIPSGMAEASVIIATYGADETAPQLSSVEIGTDGDTWTFTYDENVTATDDGDMCDGYTVTMSSTGALTFTYAGGTRGSDSVFTCTGSATVDSGETISTGIDYTQGTIQDVATNAMAALDDWTTDFTNSSSQGVACTSANDTYVITSGVTVDNTAVSGSYRSYKVVVGSATQITGYFVNVDDGGSGYTMLAALNTDDGGVPSATSVGAEYDVSGVAIPDSGPGRMELLLSSTQTLAAGTYHIIVYASGGATYHVDQAANSDFYYYDSGWQGTTNMMDIGFLGCE